MHEVAAAAAFLWFIGAGFTIGFTDPLKNSFLVVTLAWPFTLGKEFREVLDK